MNLSEKFQEMIESPMNRTVAAITLALAATFSMTGCASGGRLNLPQGNGGILPVGRVFNQNVNKNVFEAKRGLKSDIGGALRVTPCPSAPDASERDNSVLGAFARSFTPTTSVSIGDPACGQRNGVGPSPSR